MALTSKLQPQKVEIPHEPGEWIEFAPLSWRKLSEASQAASEKAAEVASKMTERMNPEVMRAMQEVRRSDLDDQADDYDRGVVLKAAIKSWSYGEPVTEEDIDALDYETAEWAFRTALRLNLRSKPEGEASSAGSETTTSGKADGQ